MNYYKLGCKWEGNASVWKSYYDVLKRHSVVLNGGDYQLGDNVAIAEGFTVKAIGIVISDIEPLSNDIRKELTPCIPASNLNKHIKLYKVEWVDLSQNPITFQFQKGWRQIRKEDMQKQIDERVMSYQKSKMKNKLIDLLEENKNLILTGAPGTGKTYLAKQIAEAMNAEICFTQFHPSYDYTDFVEGLRPTNPDENGNIGFERKDGIFKDFCKKASLSEVEKKDKSNFDKFWNRLLEKVAESNDSYSVGDLIFGLSSANTLKFINRNAGTCTKENIYAAYQNKKAREAGAFQNYFKKIVLHLQKDYELKPYQPAIETQRKARKKYVFIIDEINRGEISKIFGELFFSIDPSYRGKKGEVKTQYSNMHEDEDEMFYVPDNVYIIGTMNDIDRSVESFDFAMRRRFAWVEITAEQSANNMNLPDEIKGKMEKLNAAISKIEGLNASYHIGGAYFLDKDGKPRTDFNNIWELRLEPLFREYLRGMPDGGVRLQELKNAYDA